MNYLKCNPEKIFKEISYKTSVALKWIKNMNLRSTNLDSCKITKTVLFEGGKTFLMWYAAMWLAQTAKFIAHLFSMDEDRFLMKLWPILLFHFFRKGISKSKTGNREIGVKEMCGPSM